MVLVLLNLSAGMCAGSLASGCYFSKHSLFAKQENVVNPGARNCDLEFLVPPFWHPVVLGKTMGASGRTLGSGVQILMISRPFGNSF